MKKQQHKKATNRPCRPCIIFLQTEDEDLSSHVHADSTTTHKHTPQYHTQVGPDQPSTKEGTLSHNAEFQIAQGTAHGENVPTGSQDNEAYQAEMETTFSHEDEPATDKEILKSSPLRDTHLKPPFISQEESTGEEIHTSIPIDAATPYEQVVRYKPFKFRDSTVENMLPPHMAKRYSHIQPHLAPGGAFVYRSMSKRESEFEAVQNWETPDLDFLPPPTIVPGKAHYEEEYQEEVPSKKQHKPNINKRPNRASQFISSSQARFKVFKGFIGRNNQRE